LGSGAIDVALLRIRNVQRQMVIAVRLVEIDCVKAFRRPLIAFVFFHPRRRTTQRHSIGLQHSPVPHEDQPPRGFFDNEAVSHRIAGQGIEIYVSHGGYADRDQAKREEKNQQDFQRRLYCGSIGLRARGSRSFVVAVLGDVTKGPPSSGALSEKATSGMLLGKPSNGNSFRSGK
jgi:hypothetical protein